MKQWNKSYSIRIYKDQSSLYIDALFLLRRTNIFYTYRRRSSYIDNQPITHMLCNIPTSFNEFQYVACRSSMIDFLINCHHINRWLNFTLLTFATAFWPFIECKRALRWMKWLHIVQYICISPKDGSVFNFSAGLILATFWTHKNLRREREL